jgi:hypothetical protein
MAKTHMKTDKRLQEEMEEFKRLYAQPVPLQGV